MKHKPRIGRVYKPSVAMRLFVLLVGLMLAGGHALLIRSIPPGADNAVPFFILSLILVVDAFFLWYALLFTTQTQVVVNADGIEMQRGGAHLFTTWDNISHFGVRGAGKNQQQGIYLYSEVYPDVNGLAERLFYGRKTNFIPLGQVINMPRHWGFFRMKVNLEKLAQTEFGENVRQYAPHLLYEYDEKAKSGRRLSDRSSKSTYVVGSDARKFRKYR